jgi:hypothetical protein
MYRKAQQADAEEKLKIHQSPLHQIHSVPLLINERPPPIIAIRTTVNHPARGIHLFRGNLIGRRRRHH